MKNLISARIAWSVLYLLGGIIIPFLLVETLFALVPNSLPYLQQTVVSVLLVAYCAWVCAFWRISTAFMRKYLRRNWKGTIQDFLAIEPFPWGASLGASHNFSTLPGFEPSSFPRDVTTNIVECQVFSEIPGSTIGLRSDSNNALLITTGGNPFTNKILLASSSGASPTERVVISRLMLGNKLESLQTVLDDIIKTAHSIRELYVEALGRTLDIRSVAEAAIGPICEEIQSAVYREKLKGRLWDVLNGTNLTGLSFDLEQYEDPITGKRALCLCVRGFPGTVVSVISPTEVGPQIRRTLSPDEQMATGRAIMLGLLREKIAEYGASLHGILPVDQSALQKLGEVPEGIIYWDGLVFSLASDRLIDEKLQWDVYGAMKNLAGAVYPDAQPPSCQALDRANLLDQAVEDSVKTHQRKAKLCHEVLTGMGYLSLPPTTTQKT